MFWFKRASVVLLSSCQTLCSESEQSSSCLCSHLYIYIYIWHSLFLVSLSFSLMNITWNLPGERLTFTRRLAFEASSLKSCGREWTWTRVVVGGGGSTKDGADLKKNPKTVRTVRLNGRHGGISHTARNALSACCLLGSCQILTIAPDACDKG